MSVVNLPLKDEAGAVRSPLDAAEARMFRRPSEWRIFWEAFSRDPLAVGPAGLLGPVCLPPLLPPAPSPFDPAVGGNSPPAGPLRPPRPLPRPGRPGRRNP